MSENINSIFEKLNVEISEEIERNIEHFYAFKDNVILVTNEDKVLCFGRNKYGVLGFGHSDPVHEFTFNEELSNKGIIEFKSSECHTIARDIDGRLYGWGSNYCLGNKIQNFMISKPELNKYLKNENIINMCCGSGHTLVLTSRNEVYAWGRNTYGQIGNSSNKDEFIPFNLNQFNGDKVIEISCGSQHSMALIENGCVYIWGSNIRGQLGLNSYYQRQNKPQRIQIEVEIKKISCGWKHNLLLSREGDIYVFGWNIFKQLGLETGNEIQRTPIRYEHSEKFIDIASHYDCRILTALSENDIYYVWGNCGGHGIIRKPKETHYNSFDEIFTNFFKITLKTINETCLKNFILLKNQDYKKDFCEIEFISSGSFGIVFKASDILNPDKVYAVKKIPLSADQKEKLSEESKIVSKMNDSYVIKCFNFWIEENYYLNCDSHSHTISDPKSLSSSSVVFDPYKPLLLHIQMELCYKTLKEVIEIVNEELNEKESETMNYVGYYISSELFKELAESLSYLHTRNPPIIHRDLKPTNILVSYGIYGRFIKLADFGLAVIHAYEDQSHTKGSGTDKYMAPEVRESRKYDTKADIYSLGVITRELFNIKDNKTSENILLKRRKVKTELIEKMTAYMASSRPTCDQILNRTDIWEIKGKPLIDDKEVNSIEESFHLYFIHKKLNEYRMHHTQTGKYVKYYAEIRELGAGSYSSVYEVEYELKRFAVKKIALVQRSSLIVDPLKQLPNTLTVLNQKNEYLVKYYNTWIEYDFQQIQGIGRYANNPTLFLKMDLCHKSLSYVNQEIKKDSNLFINNSLTHLSYYLLSEIFIEILKGVNYLHNNNIIHRDLHPNNILVKSERNGNCIKICDFGLAKANEIYHLHTQDKVHIGYAAPEVLKSGTNDERADIYSLGVVVQELFCIEYGNDYNTSTMNMISKYKCLEELVNKMTMRNQAYRPNCQQILEETQFWAINESEFNFIEELNILLGIDEENRSYVQNIIISKLSNIKEKFWLSF